MTEHILEMFILKDIYIFFLKGALQARETSLIN